MTADVNVTEKVREALRQNLRDTTGACVCDPAYTERGLIDPHCGWHEAEGTTDDESVARVLAVLADPEVQAGMAGVLREHRMAWSTYTRRVVCRGCDFMAMGVLEQEEARQIEERHQADAVGEWLRGRAL